MGSGIYRELVEIAWDICDQQKAKDEISRLRIELNEAGAIMRAEERRADLAGAKFEKIDGILQQIPDTEAVEARRRFEAISARIGKLERTLMFCDKFIPKEPEPKPGFVRRTLQKVRAKH